jgi:sugar lactone lactonase YvrE
MSEVSVLSHTRCQLGEGPFYCPRRDTLYWFDIIEKRRYAHAFKTGLETFIALPEMASAMAVIDDAHDIIFTESGLWLHEVGTGCWTPEAYIEPDDENTRSNDARVHPSGAMWLGTMAKDAGAQKGAIYHYRSGAVTLLWQAITIPNAICFSPDGKTAFWTDTVTAKLMQVAVNPDDGLPVGKPSVFYDHGDKSGGLDGAVTDAQGQVWNARWGASSIDVYGIDGVPRHHYTVPAKQPTCPAFIGSGRIAITSAWQGMGDAEKAADPNGGKTFILDVGVEAKFEPKVVR